MQILTLGENLTHGVAGFVKIDDSGLVPDHHGQ